MREHKLENSSHHLQSKLGQDTLTQNSMKSKNFLALRFRLEMPPVQVATKSLTFDYLLIFFQLSLVFLAMNNDL